MRYEKMAEMKRNEDAVLVAACEVPSSTNPI